MALIDEYKQAIQDVLDGRAKEAPRPSELPWTEDKAATMWAAAAAELIAEANGGDALPDTPGADGTYALQNTVSSGTSTLSWANGGSSGGVLVVTVTEQDGNLTANKTAGEIINAMPLVYMTQSFAGGGDDGEDLTVYPRFSTDGNGNTYYGFKDGTGYYFYYMDSDYNEYTLIAETLNDYPSYTDAP